MSRARAPIAFGGGSEARARRSRDVSRVLAGTRGRARVRGLLRTRPQRRLRAPSMRSTPSAPSPEARVGRWTPRWAGDAIQPLKGRESAREARAGARETVMAVSEVDVRALAASTFKARAADLAGGRRTLAVQRRPSDPFNLDTSPRSLCSHTTPTRLPWADLPASGITRRARAPRARPSSSRGAGSCSGRRACRPRGPRRGW